MVYKFVYVGDDKELSKWFDRGCVYEVHNNDIGDRWISISDKFFLSRVISTLTLQYFFIRLDDYRNNKLEGIGIYD